MLISHRHGMRLIRNGAGTGAGCRSGPHGLINADGGLLGESTGPASDVQGVRVPSSRYARYHVCLRRTRSGRAEALADSRNFKKNLINKVVGEEFILGDIKEAVRSTLCSHYEECSPFALFDFAPPGHVCFILTPAT